MNCYEFSLSMPIIFYSTINDPNQDHARQPHDYLRTDFPKDEFSVINYNDFNFILLIIEAY